MTKKRSPKHVTHQSSIPPSAVVPPTTKESTTPNHYAMCRDLPLQKGKASKVNRKRKAANPSDEEQPVKASHSRRTPLPWVAVHEAIYPPSNAPAADTDCHMEPVGNSHEGISGPHCHIKRFYHIVTNNGPTKGDRIHHTSY